MCRCTGLLRTALAVCRRTLHDLSPHLSASQTVESRNHINESANSSNLYAELSFNYRKLNETRACAHPVLWSRDWDRDCLTVRHDNNSWQHSGKKVLSSSPASGCGLSERILSGICRVCYKHTLKHLHFVQLGYIDLQFSLLTTQVRTLYR